MGRQRRPRRRNDDAATRARSPACRSHCLRGSEGHGQHEPRRAAGGRDCRLLHDVARQRARERRTPPDAARGAVHDRDGRGPRPGPPDRRCEHHRARRGRWHDRGGTWSRDRACGRGLPVLVAAPTGRRDVTVSRPEPASSESAPCSSRSGGRRRVFAGVSDRCAREADGAHAVGLVDRVEPERLGERERLVDRLHGACGTPASSSTSRHSARVRVSSRASSAARSSSRFATRRSLCRSARRRELRYADRSGEASELRVVAGAIIRSPSPAR